MQIQEEASLSTFCQFVVDLSISQINVYFINPTTLTEIHVNYTTGYCIGMHFTSISVTDIGRSEVPMLKWANNALAAVLKL